MCFDSNINGNRNDDKFFDRDYWSLHWPKKLTLFQKTWTLQKNQPKTKQCKFQKQTNEGIIFVTHLLAFPFHAFPSAGPMTKMQKFFGAHNQAMCIATDIVTLFTIFRAWKNNTTELESHLTVSHYFWETKKNQWLKQN